MNIKYYRIFFFKRLFRSIEIVYYGYGDQMLIWILIYMQVVMNWSRSRQSVNITFYMLLRTYLLDLTE